MRVLLVQAFTALDMELVYPIGLAYLAAHLDGHQVRIFDLNTRPEAEAIRALDAVLADFEPQVVGVSLRNMKVARPGAHADDFAPQQRLLRHLRAALPITPLIVGGTAFSLYADTFMARLPEVDLGVWGEAEHRLPALLTQLDAPWRVPGVYWRDQRGVHFSGPPPSVDFAALRPPLRDLVDPAPYIASSPVSVGVQTKRGCALTCVHCSDTWLSGHHVRLRPVAQVVDELEALVQQGVRRVFFCDQIFNIPPSHAIDLCKEMVARGVVLRWSAWFNEHRNTLPDELMIWLRRAGCDRLSFSPDHVDDRMLVRLGKNFRAEDLRYTYEIAARYGFDVEYSFFLNAPGEDWRSLLAIFRFLAGARLHLGKHLRPFTLLMMQPIRIYPHTELAALARAEGLLDADDDLVRARFYDPGSLSWAVAGWQHAAATAWKLRQRLRGA